MVLMSPEFGSLAENSQLVRTAYPELASVVQDAPRIGHAANLSHIAIGRL